MKYYITLHRRVFVMLVAFQRPYMAIFCFARFFAAVFKTTVTVLFAFTVTITFSFIRMLKLNSIRLNLFIDFT